MQLKCKKKKVRAVCGEGAVADCVQVVCEDGAPRSGAAVEAGGDQWRQCEQAASYHAGDSRHPHSIRVTKLLVKMKKESFVLRKTLNGLLANPILYGSHFVFSLVKFYLSHFFPLKLYCFLFPFTIYLRFCFVFCFWYGVSNG